MTREAFARGYSDEDTIEVTVGIELKSGDDVELITRHARFFACSALGWGGVDHLAVAKRVEELIEMKYPGRAYFVETEEDGRGVQVYDPRGYIKERCNCGPRVALLETQIPMILGLIGQKRD